MARVGSAPSIAREIGTIGLLTLIDKSSLDRIDEAIDRTVREMTDVAADANAAARVMARVREADTRAVERSRRWVLTPRVAWAGVAALLMLAILTSYSVRSLRRDAEHAVEQQAPPLAAREFPTRVMNTASTVRATTAVSDASERQARTIVNARPEPPPFESDIVVASITPAPLGDAPPIDVAPLTTTSLTVEEILTPSIDVPPVSPEQQK
jgi:hypothetical protein